VTVRAVALLRQLAVRKLRAVMEVEEKRAAAVMLLSTRAPMRVRSREMEEMMVLVLSQPRETKERKRVERKRAEKKERKRAEKKERKRAEKKERKRVEKKERKRVEMMTAELETTLVARAAQARDPRRPQLR
jgi:hypothetical protein